MRAPNAQALTKKPLGAFCRNRTLLHSPPANFRAAPAILSWQHLSVRLIARANEAYSRLLHRCVSLLRPPNPRPPPTRLKASCMLPNQARNRDHATHLLEFISAQRRREVVVILSVPRASAISRSEHACQGCWSRCAFCTRKLDRWSTSGGARGSRLPASTRRSPGAWQTRCIQRAAA